MAPGRKVWHHRSMSSPCAPPPPALIQALLGNDRHRLGTSEVTLVETHISWVLLAGEFAYKIKKPLKLPFLDFSTLALRKQCCDDELRLNQRFARDIYLDVVAITGTARNPRLSGTGVAIEYAVRMRRFDESRRMDRICARGDLTAAHLSDLADTLVAFHGAAAVAPEDSRFGSPEHILAPALDNFHDLLQQIPDAGVSQRLDHLRNWTLAEHRRLALRMQNRKSAGLVRECHGDLHLANMVLVDDHVRLFDCLEFNEDLRWLDTANEIAFTYVDLLDHGQAGLASWFVDEVLSRNGDYEAVPLLRFYAVYRALVRAKVAAIRQGQNHGMEQKNAVLVCIAQAERLIAPVPKRLIITHGLAGCGKTVASSHWLQGDTHARTLRVRSDVERKRLFGLARSERSGSDTDAGIYTPDAHVLTYRRLAELATTILQAGWSVVVDAAFLKRAERDAFHALATRLDATFTILAPQADTATLRRRILARQATGKDSSEATLKVLERQLQWIEPLHADEVVLQQESALN
ncbi:MAG: AAA family ATPase [Burkholderiaceae bacterium]